MRWLSRWRFWGFPLFSALIEAVALAVYLQDMDMMCEAVEQGSGQAFGAEHLGPLIEEQIADRAPPSIRGPGRRRL